VRNQASPMRVQVRPKADTNDRPVRFRQLVRERLNELEERAAELGA
jgi:hypothetical protein